MSGPLGRFNHHYEYVKANRVVREEWQHRLLGTTETPPSPTAQKVADLLQIPSDALPNGADVRLANNEIEFFKTDTNWSNETSVERALSVDAQGNIYKTEFCSSAYWGTCDYFGNEKHTLQTGDRVKPENVALAKQVLWFQNFGPSLFGFLK